MPEISPARALKGRAMPIHKRSGGVATGVVSDEMLDAPAVISSPAVKRTVHKLMDGDLQLFQKPTSCFWQCAATVGGKQFRYSTKNESFAEAQCSPPPILWLPVLRFVIKPML